MEGDEYVNLLGPPESVSFLGKGAATESKKKADLHGRPFLAAEFAATW